MSNVNNSYWGCPVWAQHPHIELWFVVNREAYGRCLCLFEIINKHVIDMNRVFVLVLTMMVSISVCAYDFEVDGVFYKILSLSNHTVGVVSGSGFGTYSGDLIIPSRVSYRDVDFEVKSIEREAFRSCVDLKTVFLPNTITEIGYEAFVLCSSLESIVIPPKVVEIPAYTFSDCNNLKMVSLPDGLEKIQERAFDRCASLTKIEFPSTINLISTRAFNDCINLSTLIFHSSKIPYYEYYTNQFDNCNLKSIIIKDKYAIPVNDAVFPAIAYFDATLYVPYGSKEVYESTNGWKEFVNREYYVDFLDSLVEKICLEKWDNDANTVISEKEIESITNLEGVFSTQDIHSFDELCYFTQLVAINDNDFYNCRNLSSIILPESINNIGTSAFYGCTLLNSLKIPQKVKNIESSAFKCCERLKAINIPDSVLVINKEVFAECIQLGTINLPNTIVSIDSCAFFNCNSLTTINLPDSLATISFGAFWGCKKLDNIIFHDRITAIGSHAFDGCESLAGEMILPSKLDMICPYTFNRCTGLTDIFLSDNLKRIENGAFASCDNVTSIVFPKSIMEIGDSAFYNNIRLRELTLPTNLISIGRNAFTANSSITKLFIPNTVNSIGAEAFSEWVKLDTIYTYIGKPFNIDNSVFAQRYDTAILYVPKGTKAEYESVPSWNDFKYIVESGKVVISIIDTVKTYGDENPEFLYTANGVELVGCPIVNCNADRTSDSGQYDISLSWGTIKNDTVVFVNGTLSIEKAKLLASLGEYSIEEGEPLPVFEIVYEGFKNLDNVSVIDILPTASCSIPDESTTGIYNIILSGGEDNNYYFEYKNGTLTITESSGIVNMMKDNQPFNVYTMSGLILRHNVQSMNGLSPGCYIIETNGKFYKTRIK